jgi:aminoglycoside phosphotransferase (APT) family kinase protein
MQSEPNLTTDLKRRIDVVCEIVLAALGEAATYIAPVKEQGNVNAAFEISTRSGEFILRAKFDRRDSEQFLREKRCAELIRAMCDWTPKIIAVGEFKEHAYSIQERVGGIVASHYPGDLVEVWEQVGQYAAHFHAVETPGYLRDIFRGPVAPGASWCQFYFDFLGSPDVAQLVAQGFLTHKEFSEALEALQPLRELNFRPTLAHGNLSLKNIIVDGSGKAHIIDWGSCVGHMSIPLDLAELLVFDLPEPQLAAYLRGHDLPADYVEQHQLLLERLKLVRCFVNAHWLCEARSQRSADLRMYLEKTRCGLSRLCSELPGVGSV